MHTHRFFLTLFRLPWVCYCDCDRCFSSAGGYTNSPNLNNYYARGLSFDEEEVTAYVAES